MRASGYHIITVNDIQLILMFIENARQWVYVDTCCISRGNKLTWILRSCWQVENNDIHTKINKTRKKAEWIESNNQLIFVSEMHSVRLEYKYSCIYIFTVVWVVSHRIFISSWGFSLGDKGTQNNNNHLHRTNERMKWTWCDCVSITHGKWYGQWHME